MGTVLSFDVFETVLVRRVGAPGSVFLLLGRRLSALGLVTVTPEGFAAAREQAERRARRRVGIDRDPTLAQIHRELAWALELSDKVRDETERGELELEAELLRPNPQAERRVQQARRSGARVFFTSDTYLPATFVAEQLRAHGLAPEPGSVLVSCEHLGTKRDGGLFDVLVATAGVAPSDIVHLGNDPAADHLAARVAGLRTEPMEAGNLTPDEVALEEHREASGGLASALAGAARLARLERRHADTAPALRAVAADIVAPTLIAYVHWLLRQSARRDLDTVYFLSREGQVLHAIAQVLVDRFALPLELRYLHVSRQSLNTAALTDYSRSELAWSLTHVETNTVRTLLARLHLRPEAIRSDLADLGITEDAWDRVPDGPQRGRLLRAVTDGPLRATVRKRMREARTPVVAYLRQEGFLDRARLGVVDISGVGSQFKALAALRTGAGLAPADGFLFLRSRDPYLAAEGGYTDTAQPPIDAFFDDAVSDIGHGTLPGLVAMLELFCAADHGTVTGYRQVGRRVEPVLAPPTAASAISWGLLEMRDVIEDVARLLWLDPRYLDLDGDVREAIRELLVRFWSQPSTDEARTWGSAPFEGTSGGDDAPTPLARGWTAREVAVGVATGGMRARNWFHWHAGSTRLSPAPIRGALLLARSAKVARRRLGRVRRSVVAVTGWFVRPGR